MRIAPRKWQGQIRNEYLAGMDQKKIHSLAPARLLGRWVHVTDD